MNITLLLSVSALFVSTQFGAEACETKTTTAPAQAPPPTSYPACGKPCDGLSTKFEDLESVAVFAVLLAVSYASNLIQLTPDTIDFAAFKSLHNKQYESQAEEIYRQTVFEANKKYITAHNMQADAGLHTYTLSINEFADLTHEEFSVQFLGTKTSAPLLGRPIDYTLNRVESVPESVDWRTKGYVTGVKNQGQCGSCWSFSATGSIEGQHFKKTGKLVSLSEQNLVDCSTAQGNQGCNGGLMDQAFQYVIKNNGLDTEASYPYEARDGQCRFNRANVAATISAYKDIPSMNETALAAAVATIGPISVAIDASHLSFQFYSRGVYNEKRCSQTALDHGVLAVGYGSDSGDNYWIVKNSWGATWGQQGYLWMSKDKKNQCGIATQASYPIV